MNALLSFLKLTETDAVMILISAPVFVVFWQLMDRLVFRPYLKLIDERESATDGAQNSADADRGKAEALKADYESRISEVRVRAMQEKLGRMKEVSTEGALLVRKAEEEAKSYISQERQEAHQALSRIQSELLASSESLVTEIVEKMKQPLQLSRQNPLE